jgi:hypothetical protein
MAKVRWSLLPSETSAISSRKFKYVATATLNEPWSRAGAAPLRSA